MDECLELAGLPSHKGTISGADVPDLYQKGDYLAVATYAIADVLAQDELYLWMTGQTSDRPVEQAAVLPHPAPMVPAETVPTKTVPAVVADAPAPGEPTPAAAPAADDITTILAELGIS